MEPMLGCDGPDWRVGSQKVQLRQSKLQRSNTTAESLLRMDALLKVKLLQRDTFRSFKVDAVGLMRRLEQLLDLLVLSRIQFKVSKTVEERQTLLISVCFSLKRFRQRPGLRRLLPLSPSALSDEFFCCSSVAFLYVMAAHDRFRLFPITVPSER